MSSSKSLCMSIMLSLAFTACAKKGESAEPESALSAGNESTDTGMQPGAASWEGSPAPAFADTADAEPAAPVASVEPLTDEQIVGITEAVNKGEIEQAKVAQKKAKNPRVKKFASHMISQHTKAKQKGAKLVKQTKLTVADSAVATDLQSKTTEQLEKLKAAEVPDFDKDYTDGQVAQHQEVLDLLNTQLIPSATHPDLKARLEEERSMVEEHLTEAKDIQASLASP